MSAYRRLEAQIQASRRISYERDLDLSRRYQIERIERQRDYLRLKQAQKLRAEQQYQEYRLRRADQQRIAEHQLMNQRIARQTACKEYEARVESERIARLTRDKELDIQQRLVQQADIRKAEALAASRRVELQRKQQIKNGIQKQNIAVLDQQKVQEKLQRQLSEIQIKIGTIYDERQARKRKELQQLQQLDAKSFKLKQSMRSSKVQQKALQDSLAELSKLIV